MVAVKVRLNSLMEAQSRSSSLIILHNATIVTVDSGSRVFRNGGMVIEHDRIAAIGQSKDILAEFSGTAGEVMDLHGGILLPGKTLPRLKLAFALGRFDLVDDLDDPDFCFLYSCDTASRTHQHARSYLSAAGERHR